LDLYCLHLTYVWIDVGGLYVHSRLLWLQSNIHNCFSNIVSYWWLRWQIWECLFIPNLLFFSNHYAFTPICSYLRVTSNFYLRKSHLLFVFECLRPKFLTISVELHFKMVIRGLWSLRNCFGRTIIWCIVGQMLAFFVLQVTLSSINSWGILWLKSRFAFFVINWTCWSGIMVFTRRMLVLRSTGCSDLCVSFLSFLERLKVTVLFKHFS